ncbi:MAG: site-specific DNA-methyltransferase [Flavobacteriia bacterium]|nr:MAG: site-specific DNA-methyltransferase [Flavobacteriia bacterium]
MAKKDYSNLTKEQLLDVIEKLENKKKYGLVWDEERVPEKVVTDCQNKLPVLTAVNSKEITTNETEPTHILIEGDNYHALSVLNYTHKNKVDLIYIDPPYNTGSKDNVFIYNDRIIDKNDTYRHSKWLNFMGKRLELAKALMKDEATIFISIDDNSIAQLKLLCNKIFGEDNFITVLPTIMNLKGNQDQFGFAGTHEYTLVYSKNKAKTKINEFDLDDEEMDEWDEDEFGFFKRGAPMRATGAESRRENRPKMFYPILVDKESKEIIPIKDNEFKTIYNATSKTFDDNHLIDLQNKYEADGFAFIIPKNDDGSYGRWRWGWSNENKEKLKTEVLISEGNGSFSFYKKQRPSIGDLPSKKPKTLFYKATYSSSTGTALLKRIFNNKKVFNNPKPVDLIKDIILLGSNNDSIIVDFFAGSGTTAQAVLELNRDNPASNRKLIVCTNNENEICETVTLPRIEAVIKGYTYKVKKREIEVEGTGNNLKYFQTSFVANNRNKDQLKIDITKKCTEMLCLKEGIYNLYKETIDYKIFQHSNKYLAVYYDFANVTLDELKDEMNSLKGEKVLYCFTVDTELNKINFRGWKNTRLEPIPQKILDVYKRIFNND